MDRAILLRLGREAGIDVAQRQLSACNAAHNAQSVDQLEKSFAATSVRRRARRLSPDRRWRCVDCDARRSRLSCLSIWKNEESQKRIGGGRSL